jgi:hypothetical protein
MLVAGWDAGLANDQLRDGAARDRLARRTLLVVDDADLRTGLIAALVDYLRWDEAGAPVGLLLLARAAGAWWDRLVRQKELADSCTVLDLDRHPVLLADRVEHFRRASAAFAAYGGPGSQPTAPPPAGELADPAYAEPLLIHISALLRTIDLYPTLRPQGLVKSVPRATTSPLVSRLHRSGRGCCRRCVSGNGPVGLTWAPGCICPSTRTCRWLTRWLRWPR